MRTCWQWVLICLIGLSAVPSWGQSYPVKVVRYIVPGSAGSGDDVLGRIIAVGLSQVFGEQVIVDNRAGAAGDIGAEIAARAPADGYTLLQITMTQAVNVSDRGAGESGERTPSRRRLNRSAQGEPRVSRMCLRRWDSTTNSSISGSSALREETIPTGFPFSTTGT